jgi:hypothetical protein
MIAMPVVATAAPYKSGLIGWYCIFGPLMAIARGHDEEKPVVWYVDDLPENLERFKNNHQQVFEMRTVSTPEQVMSALVDSRPTVRLTFCT